MYRTAVVKPLSLACLVSLALAGIVSCSSSQNPCEEILEVKRQQLECERLRKVMNREGYPQQALTAKKRFEEACLNLRYYRDDYDTICKGKEKPIGARKDDN